MNSPNELHIRYPQDVRRNDDGSITVTVRKSLDSRFNREQYAQEIDVPAGSKDLLRDFDVIIATLKSDQL